MIKDAPNKAKTAVVHPSGQNKTFQSRKESNERSPQRLLLKLLLPVRGLGSPVCQWCEPASVMKGKSVPLLIMNWTKLISLRETSYNIKVSQQNKDGHF